MIIPQQVEVKITQKNYDYYYKLGLINIPIEERGKRGAIKRETSIFIDIENLPINSNVKILIKCEYCGKIFCSSINQVYKNKEISIIKKDCCNDCKYEKVKEGCLQKYGTTSVTGSQEHINNRKATNIIKYGYETPSKNEGIKQKTLAYFQETFGCDNPFQNEDIKEKIKNTLIEKYGVDNIMKDKETKERMEETCFKLYGNKNFNATIYAKENSMKNFGTDFPMQSEKVREKYVKTIYKNNLTPTSKQQIFLHTLLGGELNYPSPLYNLDIAFPDENIYLEYDGGGHNLCVLKKQTTQEEFDKKEMKRYYTNKSYGWKMIRLISLQDKIPNKEMLLNILNISRNHFNNNHSWIKFDIDNNSTTTSLGETYFNFKEVKSINEFQNFGFEEEKDG